jgi:1-acyl-sn-glycerol-3-phosphate acyltransferase
MVGRDKLQAFYTQNRPAMFVANHCSWMDIPFLGATVGWRNYKIVSKKELGLVPILGSAIRVGGNIMVDRTDRKSQLKTLKQGINYLKNVRTVRGGRRLRGAWDGVLLFCFPIDFLSSHSFVFF